jgi:Caspase domain
MGSLIPEDVTAPGTHALIIGVSHYRHLNGGEAVTMAGENFAMGQLSAAARSASEFAAWLLHDYKSDRAPLKSLRVLLSPSENEIIHPQIESLLQGDSSATLNNVKSDLLGFKQACDSHNENVAIVYIVGHGVQLTKHGATVLLHDVGADNHLSTLEGAIDVAGIHAAMNHPHTAQTQFWFVDACRQEPAVARHFESLVGALTLDEPKGDAETSIFFLAAGPGKKAFARPGNVSLFNEALLWALHGSIAVGPEDNGSPYWHVSATALIRQLPDRVRGLANAENVEQSVEITGKINEAVFHEYSEVPTVEVNIDLRPQEAKEVSEGTLLQDATDLIVEKYDDWPFHRPLQAGLYLMKIQTNPPFLDKNKMLSFVPPEKNTVITVPS